jgi:hypothetical protein
MTIKSILREKMSEKQFKKLPARIREHIKLVDSLPPPPKPLTLKKFYEALR